MVLQKPTWDLTQTHDTRTGTKTDLSNNTTAMLVNVPNQDFAVVAVDDNLSTTWLTPLKGFPMAIGKFKGKVLVILLQTGPTLKVSQTTLQRIFLTRKQENYSLRKVYIKALKV